MVISGRLRISQTGVGGANPLVWAENLLFKSFTENCMEMKEIGKGKGGGCPWRCPGSANGDGHSLGVKDSAS